MLAPLLANNASLALLALTCLTSGPVDSPSGQSSAEETPNFALSSVCVEVQGAQTGKSFHNTVEWEGQRYGAVDGTAILMQTIVDPNVHATLRTLALQQLARLRNRNATERLLAIYDGLREREERLGVIRCLISSEDPRGFPLFMRVLEHEQDKLVRLFAAVALAKWNVRRGVTELIDVLERCKDYEQTERSLCDEAANEFRWLNTHKGWGFPMEPLERDISSRTDVDLARQRSLLISAISSWYLENKSRFPDWASGNPLPAAPELRPLPSGPESKLELNAELQVPGIDWKKQPEKDEGASFEGKQVEGDNNVLSVMQLVLEAGEAGERIRAIERLRQLAQHLRGTEFIPTLVELCRNASEPLQKSELLFCLAETRDPRTLHLFAEILATQQDRSLRLAAAYGLAMWNARRGVQELIELVAITQAEQPERMPRTIGEQAVRLLLRLNYWKSWWAPGAALQCAVAANGDGHNGALDLCHEELARWFAENQHRFPDWQPGDQLPESPTD